MRRNSFKAWWLAARPKTLTAACIFLYALLLSLLLIVLTLRSHHQS
ncbi:MAG: hypothetical protein IK144_07870 [Bacteroidaceae bacterium]|nr:hypothetical protein [Bacteroidaceae bacterium]